MSPAETRGAGDAETQSTTVCEKRIRAEAALWVVRLHGPYRTPELEAALRRWLAEDPAHKIAFGLATDVWNDTGCLAHARPPAERRVLGPILQAIALCLVILVVSYTAYRRVSGISTEIGEQRTVSLDDGSILQLNTNSRVLVRYDREARRVILKSGEAYFDVVKQGPKERRPFIVIAGDRKVIAMGTSFLVRRDESVDIPLTVTLIDGRVAVSSAGSANMLPPKSTANVTLVAGGQRARFHRAGPPAFDAPTADSVKGWTSGHLIFKRTPLREAVAEVNRYNQTRITVAVPDEAAKNIRVSGAFLVGDSSSFASVVADSNNMQVIPRGEDLVLALIQ